MTESRPSRFSASPRWSVRSRILTALLLVATVGLVLAAGTAFFLQRDRTLRDVDARLLSRVDSARFVLTGENPAGGGEGTTPAPSDAPPITTTSDAVRAVIARVIPSDNESSLGIVDGQATWVPGVVSEFRLEDDAELVARVTAETADGAVVMGTAVSDVGVLRYVAVPITVGGDQPGVYVTAVDIDAELEPLTAAFSTYAIVAVITILAIGVVGWLIAGRLLSPIRQLRAAASRITVSQLQERIPVVGRDDVSELTVTVNDMLERLDASITSQRQLLDDVRHELKTPITIVRGHLELVDPRDPDDVRSTRAIALDELDRMTVLVDDIELLADTARASSVRTAARVEALTDDVFQKARAIPGPVWSHGGSAEALLSLDPARITQAWLQLADNAAKYSPPGSRVVIGSSIVDSSVELWVADEGPGIRAEARERIFERFGRGESGRGVAGSGLGLSIVSTIAAAHGGRVALTSSSAGSRFAISLPLAAPSAVPSDRENR